MVDLPVIMARFPPDHNATIPATVGADDTPAGV